MPKTTKGKLPFLLLFDVFMVGLFLQASSILVDVGPSL